MITRKSLADFSHPSFLLGDSGCAPWGWAKSELKRQQKKRDDQIKTFQSQQNLWQSQLKLLQSQLQEEENRSIKLEGQWIARLEEERERHRAELKIERNKRLELENHCIKNRVDEVKPNSTTDEQPVENNN
uniref:Uncharacterized protein n=1 Tax=Ditylenchus dipsaci TaxID=166011 RepID=A0A915E7H6_9BILA